MSRVDQHTTLTIERLEMPTAAAWDAYVRNHPDGLPLHLSGWREVLARTYGYDTHYLLARDDEQIVGVLPLFLIQSRLLGTRLSTPPGGLCADSAAVAERLLAAAAALGRDAGARRVVLHDTRQTWPGAGQATSGHTYRLLNVAPDSDSLWTRLDGNMRRQVRRARKNGLTVELDTQGRLLDPFYEVLSRFTHEVGTPLYHKRFLANVIDTFPAGFNIVVVYNDRQPIAGYFQLMMNQTVYGMWGAGVREALPLRPAYLGIWEVARSAADSGYQLLDMGRSPADSNAAHFKGQWGGAALPVYQQIVPLDSAESAPDDKGVVDRVQSDAKMRLLQRVWPRLPRTVTGYVGPWLRRHIPFG